MFGLLCRPFRVDAPRGGFRQRLARPAPAPEPVSDSVLGHLQDWGDGYSSAQHVLRHLRNDLNDDRRLGRPSNAMLRRVVESGGAGGPNAGGAAAHGLVTMMEECGFGRMITPLDNALASHVVLPSALLRCIHERHPQKFTEILGAREADLGQFWAGMLQDAEWAAHVREHRTLRDFGPADWRRVVPVTLFEDAGPYTKTHSCNVLSWGSFFASGGEKVSHFLLASYIKEAGRVPQDILANLWTPIFRDFDALLTTDIGGFFFLPLFAKADLECRSNSWGLPHYNGDEICTECMADRAGLPFTDLRTTARWRGALVGNAAAFLARGRVPLHPLLSSSFFWRGFFPLDLMHIADCNGVANIIAASVIRPLVQSCAALGRTQEVRLAEINRRLKDFYDLRPGYCRMAPIRLSNLLNSLGWSTLCGSTIKAANTRALAPFLVKLAEELHADPASDYDRLVCLACRDWDRFYAILYGGGLFLTDVEQGQLRRILGRLGASLMQLREHCRVAGIAAWHLSPKVHMCQHFGAFSGVVNPRRVQNYTEESSVGTITKVWAKSANGRYRRTVQRMVLLKRIVALFVRLETDGRV